jgi:rhamnopyranosyl-N-acetylglucosaminyl-diphospho-decaprenol beta-1,3/1,4-galactofuranosyltransferase
MNDKVVSVVVTHNRKYCLIKCLNSLKIQSYNLSNVIIVDNNSTDGTYELLEENGFFTDKFFIYIKQEKNIGGAGGFNVGINCALGTDASWIWVMDDDVSPTENCLEELLKYKNVSECLHPRKILTNGQYESWEHQIDILTGGRTIIQNKSFKNGKDITFTNVACFEGMLVSRKLVEKIGLPNPKYFICEDDTIYGIKASVHTNVSYVANAFMNKLLPLSNISPWKSFFIVRNRFYLYYDSCKYMELKPSRLNKILFLLKQFLEALRLIRQGRLFIIPVSKGFYDGLFYTFIGKNRL